MLRNQTLRLYKIGKNSLRTSENVEQELFGKGLRFWNEELE